MLKVFDFIHETRGITRQNQEGDATNSRCNRGDLSDLKVDTVDYSSSGLRKYIQRRQKEVDTKWGDSGMLFIIIKPLPKSSYANLVDVLDEIVINKVKYYAIVEPNAPVDSIVMKVVGKVGR